MKQTNLSLVMSKRDMGRVQDRCDSASRKALAALLVRAEALLHNRSGDAAAEAAMTILRRDRDHIGALEVLARALWQQNRFVELVATTKRLIRLDPYEPGYRLLQGAAYQCLGRYGEATKAYASISPDVPEHARSMELVEELREWQSGLVSALLNEDPVFRAQYVRDPQAACQARGFEFVPTHAVVETYVQDRVEASATARPS